MADKSRSSKSVLPIFILIVTLLGSCLAAAVRSAPVVSVPGSALGAQETFAGLQSVMRGEAGTMIMERGNLLLMAWPKGTQYAFAILGKDGSVGQALTGLRIDTTSIASMIRTLESGGWTYTQPVNVPAIIAQALAMYSVEMALTSVRAMPSVFLIPIGIFELTPEVN
jgi:hypothetical protein